jgi:hypothetical protein
MTKKELKIKNKFRGSADSKRAFERMKKSQPVSDSLSKVRSEAGFVRLLQDFIRHIADNEGMKMSPSQTINALERVRKSFETGSVTESREVQVLREAIREILSESEPATTGTTSAIKKSGDSPRDPQKEKDDARRAKASKAFSSNAAKRFIDDVKNQPANKAIGTGIKDVGDALLGSEKMDKKLQGASPGEIERLVRNYGKELKDRVSNAQKVRAAGKEAEDKEKKGSEDKGSLTTQERESNEKMRLTQNSLK